MMPDSFSSPVLFSINLISYSIAGEVRDSTVHNYLFSLLVKEPRDDALVLRLLYIILDISSWPNIRRLERDIKFNEEG